MGSEARCSLTNLGSGKMLDAAAHDWSAGMSEVPKDMDQAHKFKVQYTEKSENGVIKTVLIRTDCHPQSLLDGAVSPLAYEGGALDMHKTHVQSRWWDLIYLDSAENAVHVMLRNRHNHKYLAEADSKPALVDLEPGMALSQVPKSAMWEIRITGRALTPWETACFVVTAPLKVALGTATAGVEVTGCAIGVALSTAATAGTAVATLGGAATGLIAVAAGAAIKGTAEATVDVVTALKQIGGSLFTH